MNFRNRTREEPEINLIPLIDVLLMTLIFLLVTTSFSHEARLRLQLPEAASDAKIESATLRSRLTRAAGISSTAAPECLERDPARPCNRRSAEKDR
jgi:biopolymer transport protein ExbD